MKVDYIDCFYKEGTSIKGQNSSTTVSQTCGSGFFIVASVRIKVQHHRPLVVLGLHSQCFTLGVNVFITAHSTQHRTQERERPYYTDF